MKVIVVFAMLLSFGMTYAATSLYGACNNDGECMNGLECRELWSDCGGKKQCVCEDDDEASDTSFVYVAAAGKCKSKRTLGQSCDHSGECAYTNGQCVNGKCVCITDLRCKNNKVNGESCSQNADCSYFDVAEWAYQSGICTGGTCGCPADMDRSGANCNRVRGPVKRNNQCRVATYRKSMQCESGLQCRKCRSSDTYAKCRSGQATSLYAACNNDGECMNGLECRELWSDCGGKKQCVCEDDDEASDTSFVYVAAAGKCKSKRTLGQSCDHSGECAYTNGQCVNGKCVCITDLRCKNNKVNGESCSQSADCSYFDVAEWAYQSGICTGGTCGCPADMDRSGANCNRVRGPVKRNNQCRVATYRKSMQCESGLQCRKCRSSDTYAKCRSGQGMIHASLFGVMLMMLLSLLKM